MSVVALVLLRSFSIMLTGSSFHVLNVEKTSSNVAKVDIGSMSKMSILPPVVVGKPSCGSVRVWLTQASWYAHERTGSASGPRRPSAAGLLPHSCTSVIKIRKISVGLDGRVGEHIHSTSTGVQTNGLRRTSIARVLATQSCLTQGNGGDA